jgi:uncharacterized membrane protein
MKDEALARLSGKWTEPVLGILIFALLAGASSIIPFSGILIGGAFSLGLAMMFLKISRGEKVELANIFDGFKQFGNSIGAYILILLIVLAGFICLIVPGFIAIIALSQTYRIMADNPSMSCTDAMQRSHELMKGHRMEFFLMNLSFIGWAFLCLLTVGLGFFILAPYIATTNAVYYNYLISYKGQIDEIGSELVS